MKAKIGLFISAFLVFLVFYHNVPKKLTLEDRLSLKEIFGSEHMNAEQASFDEQILFIDRMVNVLHNQFLVGVPIPYEQSREPDQLILNGGGLCYDFSRTIEKYLMLNGFQVRHVGVYQKRGSFLNTIMTSGVYSHSLTEVKTKNGWLIVDSNLKFYAQDKAGKIYSYKALKNLATMPDWKLGLEDGLRPFYSNDIEFVYGLYSRHGGFYKPYNVIPDYNLRELFYNF